MAALSAAQVERFRDEGVLVVEDAVGADLLARLRADVAAWVEESRDHERPYGETIDGRPRFDLEAGHSAERPALRRVNAPHEVSEAAYEAVADSAMTDWAADLMGPDLRFHHCKLNAKLPGAATAVRWFTPVHPSGKRTSNSSSGCTKRAPSKYPSRGFCP